MINSDALIVRMLFTGPCEASLPMRVIMGSRHDTRPTPTQSTAKISITSYKLGNNRAMQFGQQKSWRASSPYEEQSPTLKNGRSQ